jgi:hypothetical protein
MISNITLAVFCVVMILNAAALFRHWQALRAFRIVLANLEATQRMFNDLMENEQKKTLRPPRPEPSIPFRKS